MRQSAVVDRRGGRPHWIVLGGQAIYTAQNKQYYIRSAVVQFTRIDKNIEYLIIR